MGGVVSAVTRGVPLVGALFGVNEAIRGASQSESVGQNPTLALLGNLGRQKHQEAEATRAEQQRLEAENQRAEERRRRAEEERARAEEARWPAEESARRAEKAMRQANENKRQAEESRRRAEHDRQRAEVERVRADDEARKARADQETAQRAKEASDRAAAEAQMALEKAEKDLREGIKPIIVPSPEELRQKKKDLQYREGLFHFAIAGVSGSGKSSLLNAFHGLRNKDRGAAATGVTETTSIPTRYPDPDPQNPFVSGAGTLNIPDWV